MALNPFWPSPPSFLFLAFAAGNLWGHYRAAAAKATKLQHEWGCEPAEESVRVGRLCRLLERSRVYNASHTLASLLCTVCLGVGLPVTVCELFQFSESSPLL